MSRSGFFVHRSWLAAALLLAPVCAGADAWDDYLLGIDDYRPAGPAQTQEQQEDSRQRTQGNSPQQTSPQKPPPATANTQAIRQYQLNKSKEGPRQIDRIREQSAKALEQLAKQPVETGPVFSPQEVDQLPRRFSMRSRTFYWGSKEPGYEYADYEFQYDVLDERQVNAYMEAMTRLSKRGWQLDMTKHSQSTTGGVPPKTAVTTQLMRFKRPNR